MDKYRKIKVVGKGNFGYALLVQSNIDRKFYIVKVESSGKWVDHRRVEDGQQAETRGGHGGACAESNATPIHRDIPGELHGQEVRAVKPA